MTLNLLRNKVWGGIFCLILVFSSAFLQAKSLGDNERKLLEGIRDNASQIQSASLKFRVESRAGEIDASFMQISGGNYVEKGTNEVEFLFSKGNFARTEQRSEVMHGTGQKTELRQSDAWDGERYWTFRPEANYGIIDKSYAGFNDPWEEMPFRICFYEGELQLDAYLEKAFLSPDKLFEEGMGVLDVDATHAGRKVWTVTVTSGVDDYKAVYCFDPNEKFRLIFRSLPDRSWDISYKKHGKYQVPALIQLKAYTSDGKRVQGYETITLQELTRVNAAFEKKEFQIQYPKDAKVVDAVKEEAAKKPVKTPVFAPITTPTTKQESAKTDEK